MKKITGYRPDSFADGRYAVLTVFDDGATEVKLVHYDKDHVEKEATRLNLEIITRRMFGSLALEPTEANQKKLDPIIEAAEKLVSLLMKNLPKCADQSTAVRSVREAVNWAIAAIQTDGFA